MPSNGALVVCQSGYEGILIREMQELGLAASGSGPGWALCAWAEDASAESNAMKARGAAFAHTILESPVTVSGKSVNEVAQGLLEYFASSLQGERIEAAWPCLFAGSQELVGLGRRVASVEAAFGELIKKRFGRVAKLATQDRPRVGPARGLFAWFTDFGTVQVSRSAHMRGACRMADDDLAPSRSYLKVEEAYGIIGAEPQPGETVCDLGAAPGGWSFSAAKRGARVVAVDNGPMKGGALGNPLIDHRTDDAFGFSPGRDATYDWLFSDMLEDPHKIVRLIAAPWLTEGWCRRFVINLKFGRVDPIRLLADLRSKDSPFVTHATGVTIIHLYHDREELTVTGTRA
ncbi:MAG TPA: SAM-dependent methyltransferase [Opitutaceae bacterium]|jgi:23S rRNA (cytidine2498-2'-O)-methyltransferase|nr:SAM-dependent methyltransferase [Opitutaceae bacterium]